MAKNDNPFGIRKSPVELITAQTLTLDDYVKRSDQVPPESCMSNRR
jgi:hypothetical protein